MKRLIKIVIINLVVLIIALGTLELGLRVFTPHWLEQKMDSFRPQIEVHNRFGSDRSWKIVKKDGRFLKFQPNSDLLMTHEEYYAVAHMNELGLRITPGRRNDNPEKIGVFGDSYLFGVGVEDNETFLSLLQNEFKEFDFLNFGVPGSSLPNQLFILSNRIKDFPGLKKIFFIYYLGNDFEDIVKQHHSEIKRKGKSKKVGVGRGLLWYANYYVKSNKVLNKFYLLQYIKAVFLKVNNRLSADKIVLGGFRIMNKKENEFLNEWRGYITEDLDALRNLEDSFGLESNFIIIPQTYNLIDSLRDEKAEYYGLNPDDLDPIRPETEIQAVLDSMKFKYIDITPCLDKQNNKTSLFYKYDDHFTTTGNQKAFECIKPLFLKNDSLLIDGF